MRKALFASLLAGAMALLLAQQPQRGYNPGRPNQGTVSSAPAGVYAPFELLSVFPRETAPGEYRQVDPNQLQSLADQGWQLVSVSPYVYRNEEHHTSSGVVQPLVTQVYVAYFFQRARVVH
jgi:hypothetical protein